MRGVRFRLLGPVTAVVDGHVHSLPRAQTRGLLAYLLLHAGRPVSREALTEARAAWLRSLEILAPDHPVIPRVEANLAALVQVHDRA